MSNLQAATDVYIGLDHYLISRLKKTWKDLDKQWIDKWKVITDLVVPLGSWKNMRNAFEMAPSPCTFPYPIFKRDLISIDENEDYWDSKKIFLNFYKRRLIANVIFQIDKTKREKYKFHPVQELQDYIYNFTILNEEELEAACVNIPDELKGMKVSRQRSFVAKGSVIL